MKCVVLNVNGLYNVYSVIYEKSTSYYKQFNILLIGVHTTSVQCINILNLIKVYILKGK